VQFTERICFECLHGGRGLTCMLTGTVTTEIGLDAQYWGAGIARPVHDRLQGS
jgi:hypothetical protein